MTRKDKGKAVVEGVAGDKNVVEGSGPRHARSRGINASIRRDRGISIREGSSVPEHDRVVDDYGTPGSGSSSRYEDDGPEDDGPEGEADAEEQPPVVTRGPDGRFTSSRPPRSAATWLVQGPMDGGPENGSVIPSFGAHVARYIWDGEDRRFLRCHTRAGVCRDLTDWLERFTAATTTRIRQTGLSHLPNIMHDHLDFPLISAFVERWQPDTNTFHLPFGEMTIMLHDVHYILGIRVDGDMVVGDLPSDQYRTLVGGLLQLTPEELQVKTQNAIYKNGGVHTDQIIARCRSKEQLEAVQAIGYMWVLLGNTLFTDKSGTRTHPSFLSELCIEDKLEKLTRYSWGSASLAYLYRQLGHATRNGCDSIAGCLTLLQAWIYE
ncbi:protein MAIN-LIKE 1-like [Chenopodium quinoa]|uniref:protein MAIN-LIKE 1-like n=1 Tax=Chenopodium quinoa TaxID=63459 RepID=UPI000B77C7E4|nr:protein MAIN-LIKE 1-like [Chenopodium quinoa]